jgi:hypothetical protein
MIKINIQRTPEQAEFLRLLAKNTEEGKAARELFAGFVGPTIQQVLEQEATHRMLFRQFEYDFGTNPSIPLEYFDSNEEGLFDVWSNSIAGGLPTNHVTGQEDFRMSTFRLDSAFSMLREHLVNARADVVAQGMERMAQEVLVKEKHHAWSVVFASLGAARTGGSAHIINSTTANVFQVDDVNRLKTKARRLRTSWVSGTPTSVQFKGLTHLVLSPEMMEQVRGWTYQPMNTRGVPNSDESSAVPLPEQVRQQIWDNSGLPSMWDIGFIELIELGISQAYNTLFDAYYTAGTSDPAFATATQELVLGVDLSVDAGIQIGAVDSERGTSFVVEEDDQWTKRSGKIGYFGYEETGFAWLDSKALTGIVIQ